MKIILAKHSGFCFGVTRALTITRSSRAENGPVDVLGELVHNEDVVRELSSQGIRTIKRLAVNGCNRILIIRAHGVSRATVARAQNHGYRVIDATCPMVKEIHAIARAQEQQGYRVAIIGDRDHAEVKGIAGQLQRPGLVIDPAEPLPRLPAGKRICVVVQSTQDIEVVLPIVKRLRQHSNDVRFFNTICNPTRRKQAEIKRLPKQVDVMIIIGSRTSANTRRLHEISRSLNPRSYWVQGAAEIKPSWLARVRTVGIAAGASTPQMTIQTVMKKIRALAALTGKNSSSGRRRSATRR